MTTTGQTASPGGGQFQERTLIISNLSATFSKDHDLIGNQDPYLVLELSKDTVTTRVMKSAGTQATWPAEEGYRLHDRGEHPELVVHAWNKNSLLKDTSLGEGRIAMTELGTGQEHTVPLFDKKGSPTGELRFRAQEEQGGQFGQSGMPALGETTGAAGAAGAAGAGAAAAKEHHDHKKDREYDTTHDRNKVKDREYDAAGARDGQAAYTRQDPAQVQQTSNQPGMVRNEAAVLGAGAVGSNQVTETNTSRNVNDRNVDSTQENSNIIGAGGVQTSRSRNATNTVDESLNESSQHYKRGTGVAVALESGDDHWQKSIEAAAAARKQARIVEGESAATHQKYLSAQDATRNFEKARREHMAIQERLAALDLENKRSAFDRSSKAYDAALARISGKEGKVDAAQQAANELRAVVNEKGEALNQEVNATKLHQSRLAELEAELERLTGLHAAADAAHRDHLGRLDPLRSRHRTLQESFTGVQAELAEAQQRRAELEAKERELQGLLDTHSREYQATASGFGEMEDMGRKKAADAEARASELAALENESAEVQRHLAEHRNRIGELKQDTETQLATAGDLADAAARKEAELQAAQQSIGEKERAAGMAANALSEAQAAQGPMQEKVRIERNTVDHQKEVVDEMHRKLGMAREQVDLAQARKEELWEKAKWHGEQADKASDSHFLHAHRDHAAVTGASTVPPTDMLKQGHATSSVLEKAGHKLGL